MATCINLRDRFGDHYRITFDPAYDPAYVPRSKLDPWYMVIPCKRGLTIYPHGGDWLAVEIDGHPYIAKRVQKLLGVALHQSGDQERTYVFPVSVFPSVAKIVEPKRRPRLSDEQRERMGARARSNFGHRAG